jgi:serine protease Do
MWKSCRVLQLSALVLGLALATPCGLADFPKAEREFQQLSDDAKTELIRLLIATGDFNGIYRGQFSRRLAAAVENFQSREGFPPTGLLPPNQLAILRTKGNAFLDPLGLQEYSLPTFHAQLKVPRLLFDDESQDADGYSFERADKSVSLTFEEYLPPESSFEALYERFSKPRPSRTIRYKALQPDYFVVSGEYRGRNFYTWINRTPPGSSGFTVAWGKERNAIADRVAVLLANSFDWQPAGEEVPKLSEPGPDGPADGYGGTVTGTGFLISSSGHIVTSYHVVTNCAFINVHRAGTPTLRAELITKSPTNDLALLKTNPIIGSSFAIIRTGKPPIQAGDDIVVFGFPLAGSLAFDGNVVSGNITALAGLGNDRQFFQISAPIQPGNSGGPLMDRSGNVIGVMQSKLNALLMAPQLGAIPENISFALKASILTEFLDWVGTTYQTGLPDKNLSVTQIRQQAEAFTAMIECIRVEEAPD